jgi:SAM-dependent methyltransferase
MSRLFEEASIDTVICNSTTHELWSYLDQEESIGKYLEMKHDQLREGGRLIIRDVVGPENKEEEVHAWFNSQDGVNDEPLKQFDDKKELAEYLSNLSTRARFKRFANDFLEDARREGKRSKDSKIKFEEVEVEGETYFKMPLKDAVEFMSKKDYTDNWTSELNEEFAFWSFEEWKDALRRANFYVIENHNDPELSSRAYTNQWIKENKYEGRVSLYKKEGAALRQMEYPVTNMLLVGEKVKI